MEPVTWSVVVFRNTVKGLCEFFSVKIFCSREVNVIPHMFSYSHKISFLEQYAPREQQTKLQTRYTHSQIEQSKSNHLEIQAI